jgi:hypothetical protein
MGKKMEKKNWQNVWMGGLVMGECKDRQRKSCNTKTNCKHSKWGYGRLPLGDVYTYHFFIKERSSLKKPILEHFFTSLLGDLSIEDFVTLGNLLSIKFLKPQRCLYATPCK